MFFPRISGYFFQLLATLLGDLQSLSYGVMFGITPSAIILYQSRQTPLKSPITEDEASWITSYLCIGGVLGTVICGYSADKWGRKAVLQLSGLLQIIGWSCLLFGYEIWHIFLSRFLVGVASGGAYIVLPIYVAEISEDKWRGSLGSYISALRSLGILLGFILGAYVDYDVVPFLGSAIPIAFTMTFPFVQESPYFFAMKNNIPMMEKSLRWFRGIKTYEDRKKLEFLSELDKFRKLVNAEDNQKQNQTSYNFCSYFILKIFVIAFVLITTTQFCGVFAVLNYANVIFTDITSGFSAYDSGIILAVMQFLSTYLGTLLADRLNRKILITFTSLGAGLSLVAFGVFIYLKDNLVIVMLDEYKWIPLLCLCFTIVLANMGLYPLAFVVVAEIFPEKIKGRFTTFFYAYLWLLAFLSVKYYYLLTDLVGIHGCMWIFAGFCIFEFIFTLLFVPETRGKSFEEIQYILGGKDLD